MVRRGVLQLRLQAGLGLPLFARQYQLTHGAFHGLFPEQASGAGVGQRLFHRVAQAAGEQREPAIGRGHHGLDPAAQQAHQYRAVTAAGNRDGQR